MKKIFIFLFLIQLAIMPVLTVNACANKSEKHDFGDLAGLSGALDPVGITVGSIGATTMYVIERIKNIPHLGNWSSITGFEAKNTLTNSELQSLVSSVQNSNVPLLSTALSIFSTSNASNFKPVSSGLKEITNVNAERTFVISDSEIKNNSIHYYNLKLPQDLQNAPNGLKAEAIIVYKTPTPDYKVNFRLFNSTKYDDMTQNINKIQSREKLVTQGNETNINTIQKEFKISDPTRPLTLAISLKNTDKKAVESNLPGVYSIIVKFMP